MDNSSSKEQEREARIMALALQLTQLGLDEALKLIKQVKEST